MQRGPERSKRCAPGPMHYTSIIPIDKMPHKAEQT